MRTHSLISANQHMPIRVSGCGDTNSPLPLTSINFTYMWFIDPATAQEHNKEYGDRYGVTESCYSEWIDPFAVDIDVLADQIAQLKDWPRGYFSPLLTRE